MTLPRGAKWTDTSDKAAPVDRVFCCGKHHPADEDERLICRTCLTDYGDAPLRTARVVTEQHDAGIERGLLGFGSALRWWLEAHDDPDPKRTAGEIQHAGRRIANMYKAAEIEAYCARLADAGEDRTLKVLAGWQQYGMLIARTFCLRGLANQLRSAAAKDRPGLEAAHKWIGEHLMTGPLGSTYMPVKEASHYTGVAQSTVRRWIKQKLIRAKLTETDGWLVETASLTRVACDRRLGYYVVGPYPEIPLTEEGARREMETPE